MRIRISDDRRATLRRSVQAYFLEEFDEELSDFRADGLLDLLFRELGPAVYNQGVRDAQAYMAEKLADLDAEVYEREPRP